MLKQFVFIHTHEVMLSIKFNQKKCYQLKKFKKIIKKRVRTKFYPDLGRKIVE